MLWHRARRGDRAALEKLLLYNLTDVVNLVELAEAAVAAKRRAAAFPGKFSTRLVPSPRFAGSVLARWIAEEMESFGV